MSTKNIKQNIKKLKKQLSSGVWYRDELWNVINIHQIEDRIFIFVELDSPDSIDAVVIDAFNEEFFRNTKAIRKYFKKLDKLKEQLQDHKMDNADALISEWLWLVNER